MSTFAKGRYAQAISDRSGQAFPYREMLKEWNGSFVHRSEYEKKHPQLERKAHGADPQGLQNARPARTEPAVARILNLNPLTVTTGSSTIVVFEEAHGRSSGDIVRFRDGEGNFGIQSQNINRDVGYQFLCRSKRLDMSCAFIDCISKSISIRSRPSRI